MDINITNDTVFIDDKQGAFGVTILAQHAVLFGDLAMRPKIAQKRIVNSTQAVGPGF